MKKLLLGFAAMFIIFQLTFAQCTPDAAIGQGYMFPEKLANAMAGNYYTQTITFRVVRDTQVVVNNLPINATIDSARVVYIGGIPSGYSYTCNNATCTWPGGQLGCALLQGVCDTNSTLVGEYPIKIYVRSWGHALGTPMDRIDSSGNYTFKIVAYSGQFEITKTEPLKIYPNPTTGDFKIELRNIISSQNSLKVFDNTGRIVFEKHFGKPDSYLSIEEVKLSDLNKGLYFVTLQTDEKILQQRIILH